MTKKKKILFIHQNFPGQFKSLVPKLIDEGHEVHALGEESSIKVVDDFPGLNLHYYKIAHGNAKGVDEYAVEFETKMIRARFAAEKCEELKNDGLDPDLIIAHPGWGESFFLKDIWPNVKTLSYFEIHWNTVNSDVDFDEEFYDEGHYKFTVKKLRARNLYNHEIFHSSDKLISPTEYQKNTAPQFARKKITVVHDGIDTEILKPNSDVELVINNNIKLSNKDKIITFINRNFEPQRGYHVFMRSLPKILKENTDAHVLLIGGDGKGYGLPAPNGKKWKDIFYNEVKDQIDTSRVHFLGRVSYSSLISLFQISSVHVYLTYPFVLSWSLLEAMSCGCLIVGSNTDPVKEVIKDKSNGVLVDFFDTNKLTDVVSDTLQNPEKYTNIRKGARNFIKKKYDLRKVCLPKQLNIINELLGE